MTDGLAGNIHNNRYWYLLTVCVLLVVILAGYFALNIEGEKSSRLKVDEVYFRTEDRLGGEDTALSIMIFLTNDEDGDIDSVSVRAFAVETDSNLAMDEDRVVMGKIGGQTTSEGRLNITVPNNESYRVEILVFEESKLTLKGSGTIDLKGVGVASDYRTERGGSGAPSFEASEDDTKLSDLAGEGSAPFALCMFLILGFVIVIVIIGVAMRVSKKVPDRSDDYGEDEPREKKERAKRLEDFISDERPKEEREGDRDQK